MSAALLATLATAIGNGTVDVIDLTHPLDPDFPVIVLPPEFGQSAPLRMETISRYDADGPAWYWNNITVGEHTGTHLDAPVHWITGRELPANTVDAMPTRAMLALAVVVDMSAAAAADDDALLTTAILADWEARHGRIPAGAWVLMRTDWSRRTGAAYANLREDGAPTPGPDVEAIRWLVDERGILGFGTETIGTDAGQAAHFNPPYPAHHFLHGAGRYGLQCLANLDRLPPTGAVILAAPLAIRGGSGSPLRVLALVSHEE